jgi:membrane protease YdiL (CAAX protease family)
MTSTAELTVVRRRQGSVLELSIVFGVTVALPIALNLLRGRFFNLDFGETQLKALVVEELIVVLLMWPWLARRGWNFVSIAGSPEPADVWKGVLLFAAAWVAFYFSWYTYILFIPSSYERLQMTHVTGAAAGWVVALTCIVNPIFEELLWLGYGFNAMRRYGVQLAAVASVALRVIDHTYQGQMACLYALPFGVFTLYYVRTRRLWPIVVAHMLWDVLASLTLVR